MTKHIVIISTIPKRGLRLSGFKTDYEQIEAGLRQHRPGWKYSAYAVGEGDLPDSAEGIDGVVFSGSPSSVNDNEPWVQGLMESIRYLHEQHVPTFGICFGHQAIAKALGGKVCRNPKGWSLGVVPIRWHGDDQHPATDLSLYAVHSEQVARLPDGARVLSSTDNCEIAGFRIGNHIMTTQHHPEMPVEYVDAILDSLDDGSDTGPGAALISAARASLPRPTDNSLFMGWVAQFFAQDRTARI